MRRGTKKIKALRLVNNFWKSACRYDNIPVNSSFVIFSNNNPYISLQQRAYKILYNNM